MTVASEINHNQYVGNGVTTSFDYGFRIFKNSHLLVQVSDLDGVITALVLGTDYTVTGVGASVGKVILTAPLASGWGISIDRNLPIVQETDLRNQGTFYPETHEDAFDYLTMLIQRVFSSFGLALKKPSWIAKYYDASLNRISNLEEPLSDRDAATKKYVDSLSTTGFGKTLRTPEVIPSLPPVDARKNKILGMDELGNPVMLVPESGSAADVLLTLGSELGAGYSLSQIATAYQIDFTAGIRWSPGLIVDKNNWLYYGNLVWFPYSDMTQTGTVPNYSDFYVLSQNGEFSPSHFGIANSLTGEQFEKIKIVMARHARKFLITGDLILTISKDLEWDHGLELIGKLQINSLDLTQKNILIRKSNIKINGVTFGDNVNILYDSSASSIYNISLSFLTFTGGSIIHNGGNRCYGIEISDVKFDNTSRNTVNFISLRDVSGVKIRNCNGQGPSNAAIVISPSYSYTTYDILIDNNDFKSCAVNAIVFSGSDEIGVINSFKIINNTLDCLWGNGSRVLALYNCSGGVVTGNHISGNMPLNAVGTHDVIFSNNTLNGSTSPVSNLVNCSGWVFTGNKSYALAFQENHIQITKNPSSKARGEPGRGLMDGNIYYNGTKGISIMAGYAHTIGRETFITTNANNTVGRVYNGPSSFAARIDGNQRIIAPPGAVAVTNENSSSVIDGNVTHSTSLSNITPVVNGAVISSLHGKVYHFTVSLNNNMDNFQSVYSTEKEKKPLSSWVSSVSGAKLAINASPSLANGRMQDSFVNGMPTSYPEKSTILDVHTGCVIRRDGYMHVRYMPQNQLNINDFILPQLNDYIWQSAFFNIPLIIGGSISPFTHDATPNPRTAIGQTAAGVFHIIVVDGRNADSAGCTTLELANYLLSQGCVTAFNLDGGGSSTIWYNGSVINKPSDGNERLIAEAWVFK
jgi:hypothetical protein